jgi:oxygen-dependent protoporphyrinogen oxidase
MTQRVVVVGGGIAGLAAAHRLRTRRPDLDVVLLDQRDRPGGKLSTGVLAGGPVERGAESFLMAAPQGGPSAAAHLAAEVGLGAAIVHPTPARAAVALGGVLRELPAGTLMGIPLQTPAAMLDEPSPVPLLAPGADVTVGGLVRPRRGDAVVDHYVDPLLGGVYAGRADQLSLRATMAALAARLELGGSLVEAARAVTDVGTRAPSAGGIFTSLRGGVGRLPEALAASGRFAVRTRVTVRAIRRTETGFALECGAVPTAELIEADAVIVAAPAAKAARLLASAAPAAARELAGIDSASVAIVTFAFPGSLPTPGSGLLVGAGERLVTKAVTLSSQKWPLATDGVSLARASVGRIGETLPLQLEDGELVALVRRELGALLGLTAEPVDTLVTRWGGGLPQYAVGHLDRIARVRASVAAVPGLAVCGAAYDGVGIPACIGSARAAVDRVRSSVPVGGN